MEDKTKEQLQSELDILNKLKEERRISDNSYAIKLVEKIVFGVMAAIAVAVIGYLVTAFLSNPR